MFKKYFKIQLIISTVFQAITSAVIPPILLALLAKYLVSHFGIGEWLMAVGVLLGIAIGVTSMIRTIIKASHILGNTDASDSNEKADKKGSDSNGI